MKEFTPEILFEWVNAGMGYLVVKTHTPELVIDEEVTEFIVAPLQTLADVNELVAPGNEQEDTTCFEIHSAEAYEVATGVIGCKFYVR
jgi:hypothetical protein